MLQVSPFTNDCRVRVGLDAPVTVVLLVAHPAMLSKNPKLLECKQVPPCYLFEDRTNHLRTKLVDGLLGRLLTQARQTLLGYTRCTYLIPSLGCNTWHHMHHGLENRFTDVPMTRGRGKR